MTDDQDEDIDIFLEKFLSVEEVLPLTSKSLTNVGPAGMSIPVWFEKNMVGNIKACELDIVKELKVEEKNNLFAIFPIDTTIQDGGKRKRSN